MLVGRRYVISGRVQRVGYRMFAAESAGREGISGYVRNQHDGTVEVVAEGDAEALERFERALRQGPRGGRVEDVVTTQIDPVGRFGTFTIKG